MISNSKCLRNLRCSSLIFNYFIHQNSSRYCSTKISLVAVKMQQHAIEINDDPRRIPRRFFSVFACKLARGSRKSVQSQHEELFDHAESVPVVDEKFPKMYRDQKEKPGTQQLINLLKKDNVDLKDLVKNSASFSDSQSRSDSDVWTTDYSETIIRRERDQAKKVPRPKVAAELTSVVLFPGQGSQFIGMGAKLLDYPNVKEIYGLAGEILKYDLLKMCLGGPNEELNKTVHCQTAVFVTSVAALEKLKREYPAAVESCASTAGFSVGEYAALVFAGSLSFEDGLRLVKVRAEAMQAVSEAVPSGMLSVMVDERSHLKQGMDIAKKWCLEKQHIPEPVCKIANYLFPEGKVIAGNIEALDFLVANAKMFGIRPLKRLPVSGAFHTPLMYDAREAVYEALKNIKIKLPSISVHSNVTGTAYTHPAEISSSLVKQIYSPVKWEQTMHCVYERRQGEDFPNTYEVGPGNQLGAILKRTNAKAYAKYIAIEV